MPPARRPSNQFRIIAGRWRGRRLGFPPLMDIRPSPDRVRETLFNWLRDRVAGARCLDLFAGSGALGLEALSREAAHVVFVDREARALRAIGEHLASLGAAPDAAGRVCAEALDYLGGPPGPFDIVFLDPPYRTGLLQPCLTALLRGWLAPGWRVYAEAPQRPGSLPKGITVLRETRAGQVWAGLLGAVPPEAP
ncbi:MAG TPA: 16S rRNA (guanine(966)-N(2))-methyltransferase RsmD [Gammaproteobacteria bacterium]|nr:16S rRNA (guanine(966)-N(2))-methyltransferase RsmD [Gammaproteobacteria bacterium]